MAELRYCPETHSLNDVVNRVASYLAGRPGPSNGHVNGTDGANGHLYPTNGHANGTNGHANGSPSADANGRRARREVQGDLVGKSRGDGIAGGSSAISATTRSSRAGRSSRSRPAGSG